MSAYRIECIITTDAPLKNISLMSLATVIEDHFGQGVNRVSVQHIDMKEVSVTRGSTDEESGTD